jgi:hypothetical protein
MAATDFDFEHGTWTVAHRRLQTRLKGANDWQDFAGRSQTSPVLGGAGNIEDNWLDFPGAAYRAIAIRSFDAGTGNWAIWWLDQRAPHGLDVPVIGRFADHVGSFLADDTHDGRPVRLRFQWHTADPAAPRWEQALSADGGATWETNWIMQFAPA